MIGREDGDTVVLRNAKGSREYQIVEVRFEPPDLERTAIGTTPCSSIRVASPGPAPSSTAWCTRPC